MKLPPGCSTTEGYSTFYMATGSKVIGEICLTDQIRPDARDTITQLKQRGISEIILLSGDKQQVATKVADLLGIEKAYGSVMPDQKLILLKSMQETSSSNYGGGWYQ